MQTTASIGLLLPPPPPSLLLNIASDKFDDDVVDSVTHDMDAPLPPPPPPPNPTSQLADNNNKNIPNIDSTKTPNENCRYPSVKTRILQWQNLHKDHIESTIWCDQKSVDQQKTSSSKIENTMKKADIFKR